MRRILIAILILAALGTATWFGYQQFTSARAATTPNWEVVSVRRATIASTVSATGTILPERQANLTFQTTGTVNRIYVEVGQAVAAGQLLAELDTTDLELAMRQAEIALRQAQAQLAQLEEGPTSSELAAAQAALESAQTAYQQLLKGPDKDQIAVARAQVEQARVALNQAQQAYDKVKDRPDVGLLPQALQLQQATINFETAEAQFRVTTRPATAAQLAQAQAQIAQAQANLDRLRRGPSAAQRAIAQASVEQAQLALEQAQRRLNNALIRAPWDGIITAINLIQGTAVQPGAPAIQITDLSKYHLDVQVDEVDIAGIVEGQPVTIEVDALPDLKLAGSVQRVASTAQTTPTGGVTYQVRIAIEHGDTPLRAGMSATATIVASVRKNVLVVPNRAVQIERETGRTFVERLINGEPQRVEVRLGLRDEQQVEVREGLNEGDELVIRQRTGLERLQQTFAGF
ncbi:MAG: efflux RND transporter periplasmic adaptor subunit [Anaerolineae bacterium]